MGSYNVLPNRSPYFSVGNMMGNLSGDQGMMPAVFGVDWQNKFPDAPSTAKQNSSGLLRDSNGNWNFDNIGASIDIGAKLGNLLMNWQGFRQGQNQFNKQYNLQKQVWQKNLENQSKAYNLNLDSTARVRNAMESGGFNQQRFIDQNRLSY